MSGIAVESINETFISIAFFLPFFPLTVPRPLPFPVVLVTYEHNHNAAAVKPLRMFLPAATSSFLFSFCLWHSLFHSLSTCAIKFF
jgi:hypothetical protein